MIDKRWLTEEIKQAQRKNSSFTVVVDLKDPSYVLRLHRNRQAVLPRRQKQLLGLADIGEYDIHSLTIRPLSNFPVKEFVDIICG